MVKKESVDERLKRMIEKEIPIIMESIMQDTELNTQRKAAQTGLANTALHHLRLLRGARE